MSERKLSRREFLLSAAAAVLFPACETVQNKEQSTFPDARPKIPIEGDIISYERRNYLLRRELLHEISDLNRYKKLTKFNQYKRRIFDVSSRPQRRIADRLQQRGVIDRFTGGWKDAKLSGGEINIFFPGFMTDEGQLFDVINPSNETFYEIRNELKKKNWELLDNLFFTYGKEGFDEYNAKDTIISPVKNIDKALEFFDYAKNEFPLCQFNLIAHSLGGIFALEVARKNVGAINNIILLESPVNGLRKDNPSKEKAATLKNLIRPFAGDEYVTDYLFDIWDKNQKEENENFIKNFIGAGGRFLVVASANDLVVPLESKIINGTRQLTFTDKLDSSLIGYIYHHGKSLKDAKVKTIIADIIGENESRNV